MSLLNPSKGWRSSSSRLLALYSSLFVAWSCILMGCCITRCPVTWATCRAIR